MPIYVMPLKAIQGLLFTAISIVQFFLLVRAVLLWRDVAWLRSFDVAGTGLVDGFLGLLNRVFHSMFKRRLSARGSILIGLIFLELTRLLVGVLC